MTSNDLIEMVKGIYCQPEWALFEEVTNGTGSASSRRADAIAFNLWPSRGLEIVGFEVKVSRGDWLNEKKNPKKAEEGMAYCDTRILVTASPDIALPDELPMGWGLLTVKNDKLKMTVKPVRNEETKPVNRTFMAAVIRRAYEAASFKDAVEKAKRKGRQEGYESAQKQSVNRVIRAEEEARAADLTMDILAKELGFDNGWQMKFADMKAIGHAYHLYKNHGLQRYISNLKSTCKEISQIVEKAELSLEEK